MTRTDRDLVIARALARVDVPPHEPDFWAGLGRQLAVADRAAEPLPGTDPPGELVELTPDVRARRQARSARTVVAVAAAVVVALGAFALVRGEGGERDLHATASSVPNPSPPTTAVPPASAPGSSEAVLDFLDALGRGDLERAASHVGPRSEAYANATAGSVADLLRVTEEGYGAWAAATDRATRVVEIRPGDVVVVVSGTIRVEGNVERRSDAFPARYAESVKAWFVEPWAFGGSEQPLRLVSPAPAPGSGGALHLAPGAAVEVQAPAGGAAWFSLDGGSPQAVEVGGTGVARWRVPSSLAAGRHTLVVAYVDDERFAALARDATS